MTDIVMRDDLHRTVPVPQCWKTVLRYAPNKVDRVARLPGALAEAVRSTLNVSLTQELVNALRTALSHGLGDLFGPEGVSEQINRCAASIKTATDRELFETVRTAAAFKHKDANAFTACMQAVTNGSVDRFCEQLVATVRIEHPKDARELRAYLDSARRECDFSRLIDADGNIVARKRSRRSSLDLGEVVAP